MEDLSGKEENGELLFTSTLAMHSCPPHLEEAEEKAAEQVPSQISILNTESHYTTGCFSLCHFGDRSLYIRSKQGPEPQMQISYEGSYKE